MKNIGLKKYSTNLSISLPCGKASINLCPQNNNAIIEIPLVERFGLNYVFNFLSKEKRGNMGFGGNISLYKELNNTGTINADFSIDKYTFEKKNKETGLTLKRDDESHKYRLDDGQGNIIEYDESCLLFPSKVIAPNNKETVITKDAANKFRIKTDRHVAEFTLNPLQTQNISTIEYYYDDCLVQRVDLSYTNNLLSKIKYTLSRGGIITIDIIHTDSSITVKKNLNGDSKKIVFANGMVEAVYSTDSETTNKLEYSFSCDEEKNITTTTNANGLKEHYFFERRVIDGKEYFFNSLYASDEKDIACNELNNDFLPIYGFGYSDAMVGDAFVPFGSLTEFGAPGESYSTDNLEQMIVDDTPESLTNAVASRNVDVHGIYGDTFVFTCLAKCEASLDEPKKVTILLNGEPKTFDVYDNWKMLCFPLRVKESFEEVLIEIKSESEITEDKVIIGAINFFKAKSARTFEYDEDGNIVEENPTSTKYDDNTLKSIIDGNGAKYFIEYDDRKNMTKFRAPHGVVVDCGYDENHNLTSQTIQSQNHDLTYTKAYFGDKLLEESDDLKFTRYKYDGYGSLNEIEEIWTYLSRITAMSYDEYGNLSQLWFREGYYDGVGSARADYEYDSLRRLIKISLMNNTYYEFEYDGGTSRILKIKMNGVCIFRYEYRNGELFRQYYGNSSDYYEFHYNNNKSIDTIAYPAKSITYKYDYDIFKRLLKISKTQGSVTQVLEEYVYGVDGEVTCVKNPTKKITKISDANGEEIRSTFKANNKTIIQEHDTLRKSVSSNPENIVDELKNKNGYNVASFINGFDCSGTDKNSTYACYTRKTGKKMTGKPSVDGAIPYVNSSEQIYYVISDRSRPQTCETVAFWFKNPSGSNTGNTKYCLFSADRKGNDYSGLAIYKVGNTIQVELRNVTNVIYNLASADVGQPVINDVWNFIALSISTENGPDGDGFIGKCNLIVNGRVYTSSWNDKNIYANLTNEDLEMCFGYQFDYRASSQKIRYSMVNCEFAFIAIGNRKTLSYETVYDYYQKTKDIIYDNSFGNDFVDCSMTHLLKDGEKSFNGFKVYPLENNPYSLDYDPSNPNEEDVPVWFDARKGSSNDFDKSFNFNGKAHRYAFVADGTRLMYRLNLGESNTIGASFFTTESNELQYLFDIRANIDIKLYRNEIGYLVLEVDGIAENTNIQMSSNAWHDVSISTDLNIQSDSRHTSGTRFIRVLCDNEEHVRELGSECSTVGLADVMLGRSSDTEIVGDGTDQIQKCFAFSGQISNFVFNKAYCYKQTIQQLFVDLKHIYRTNYYDELGFLGEEQIKKGGRLLYDKEIVYDHDRVHLEVFTGYGPSSTGGTFSRTYSYDRTGFLTGVADSRTNESVSYEYNARGFLHVETRNGNQVEYHYDNNGNITRRGDDVFTYDTNAPDKLVRYNNKEITYSSSNPGNITGFGNIDFEYQGRRLVEVCDSSNNIMRPKISKYEYNEKGLRTVKRIEQGRLVPNFRTGVTSLVTELVDVINYEYDGNNLIYEKGNSHEVFYLYDELNEMYGIISDGRKYFFIRDFLHNILGLVDEEGAIAAQYTYDAFGNLINETGDVYNPIRYKGYYFDQETGFFYCKSRYYVPTLCRWLNMDSPNFLQDNNLNKMNLFAYCNNNPVMYYDPDGHFCFIAFLIAVGIGIIVSATLNIVKQYTNQALTGESWSWGDFVGSIIGGAVGGAVSFFMPAAAGTIGIAISGFISGCVETASSMALQNAWEGTNYSPKDIIVQSLIDGGISAVTSVVGSKIKIPHITSGRGSFGAVSKQIYTKFCKNQIHRIALQTFGKMIVASAAEELGSVGYDMASILFDFIKKKREEQNVSGGWIFAF